LCLPPNEIIDHKSTASLNYALTEEQARRDPQALIYAGVAMSGGLGLDFEGGIIRFRLNYATTKGAVKTRSIYVDLPPEEIVEGLDKIGSSVITPQLALSQSGEKWEGVEPNYSACDAFGGCPFRQDCQKSARPKVKEILTVGSSDNFKKALERRKAQKKSTQPPVSHTIQRPSLPTSHTLDSEGAQYRNANPPDGLPDGAPLPQRAQYKKKPPRYKGKSIGSLKAQELKDAIQETSLELTEAQRQSVPDGAAPKGTKADNKTRLITMLEIKNNPQRENVRSPMTTPNENNLFWSITTQTEPIEPVEVVKTEPVEPVEVVKTEPVEVVKTEPVEVVKTEPVEVTDTEQNYPPEWDIYTLKFVLVDAHTKGAEEIALCLNGLIQEIENKYELPISVIKYNEGWKELAGYIAARGWQGCGLPNIIRVDSASPLWTHCAHVIIPLADHVIRGTR
jgi:hypothetical protein